MRISINHKLIVAATFLSFATYSQDINKVTALDTVYIYFEEDGKYELRNDKIFYRQSESKKSLVVYEYNLKGTGKIFGEFRFINKNFNDSTAIIERPVKISKKDLKQKKDKLITIKFFIEHGYRNSFFSAICYKKAIFIIEKKKDNTYTIMNAETYFAFPFEE